MKNCIIVLGMHRSGTSALMGTLDLCGVDLGKNLLGATEHNQKGYFENEKIVDFNEKLLRRMNTLWYDIALLNDSCLIELIDDKKLRQEAISILDKEFVNKQLIGIKDPRMCLLFPFWSKLLSSLGYTINVVMTFREPYEIVNSLYNRDGFEMNFTLLLWAKYILYSEKYSRNFQRYFSTYENLLSDPKKEILSISSFFNLNFPIVNDSVFEQFIDKKLNRSSATITNLWVPEFIEQVILIYKKLFKTQDEKLKDEFDTIFNLFKLYHRFFYNSSTRNLFNIKFTTNRKNKQLLRRIKKVFKD